MKQDNNQQEVVIHPTAIVAKSAQIGVGVRIGPFSIIGAQVVLEDFVTIDSHCVVEGHSRIGAHSRLWPFVSYGTNPQDLKFHGENAELICGSHNNFREYSNFSIGTDLGGGKTSIGSHNLFMVNSHVAHDCIIGDHCILANGVSLGGHVTLGHQVILGGHSACHQFVKVGDHAMAAGGSIIVQDVPNFVMVHGNHAQPSGINSVGLKRRGFSNEEVSQIKTMYKIIYKSNKTLDQAMIQISEEVPSSSHKDAFLSFLKSSTRGICR